MTQLESTRPAVIVLPLWLGALYLGFQAEKSAGSAARG